jgi:alpha-tubulin suppressor-like RCC1 family protein
MQVLYFVIGLLLSIQEVVTPQERAVTPAQTVRSGNNLVVEARSATLARLRFEVTGPDIKEPIKFELEASQGSVSRGIRVPAGGFRTIQITAYDTKGQETHRGLTTVDIGPGRNGPFVVLLQGSPSEEPLSVLMGSYHVTLERKVIQGKLGPVVRFQGSVLDADERPVKLASSDVTWNGFDLPPGGGGFTPCPGAFPCIEFRLQPQFNPEYVMCITDYACRNSLQSSPLPTYSAISAGEYHTCVLHHNGKLYCWGANQYGQLGFHATESCRLAIPGNFMIPCSTKPVQVSCEVSEPCTFVAVSAGKFHTCAVDTRGHAWCWGRNDSGQLGVDQRVLRSPSRHEQVSPRITVDEINIKFTQISAGFDHTCARSEGSFVYCWGSNVFGQLGRSSSHAAEPPARIDASTRYLAVSSGQRHTCAIQFSRTVDCWGDNMLKELNDDPFLLQRDQPLAMERYHPAINGQVVDLVAAGRTFTCAHVEHGETVCWGDGMTGESVVLATPSTVDLRAVMSPFTPSQACAVADQEVFCGEVRATLNPTPTSNQKFTQVAAGVRHTCALDTSGNAYCLGENGYGQLGDGTTSARGNWTRVVDP